MHSSILGGSAGKESACNAGDLGLIPGLGRSLGEGNSYPLQYSGLEKSTDCIVHGVEKSQRRQSDFHFQRGLEFIANLTKPLLQTHRSLRARTLLLFPHGLTDRARLER